MNVLSDEKQAWKVENKVRQLGSVFAARAVNTDLNDSFVAENVADLKRSGIYGAGVPRELGGGGVSYSDMAHSLRTLAHYCGSTALMLSMHQHLVAALVWRWQHQQAPVDKFLSRIAQEQLVLVSTGGADWLNGSGTAERVEGGFLVSGTKIFASGCPAGDILMTMAVYQDPIAGPTVLHFPISMGDAGIVITETWKAMGMRGTGSHEVTINSVFVSDGAISVRRPQGQWHPSMHLVSKIALPLIYGVYVGLAEAVCDDIVNISIPRRNEAFIQDAIGEITTELRAAQWAHQKMIEAGIEATPGLETTTEVMVARGLVERSVLAVASQAMDLAGGAAYMRRSRLERLFRDIQAVRYHPLRGPERRKLAGRLRLGLSADGL